MKTIPLSQGLVAFVDDEDYERVSQDHWHAVRVGRTFYAGHMTCHGKDRKVEYLHVFLTAEKGIDHADGNGLNNCRSNLRNATPRQQSANRRKQGGTSSKFKGVCWKQFHRRWQAAVQADGCRQTYLGNFVHEEDAARAYDAAARLAFGEFAALNFPGPGERSALA